MEIIAIVVVVAVIIFFFAKGKPKEAATSDSKKPIVKAAPKQTANIDSANGIPSGYQIWVARPDVAGLLHHKADALAFARSSQQQLLLEIELNNTHDANAIKLIGVGDGRQCFIGYVPKEISAQIAATDTFEHIQARLKKTFVGDKNFVDIEYQIIGLKTHKKVFDAYHLNKAATDVQKYYFKFFDIPLPKELTSGAADSQIAEHKKTVTEQELTEWVAYQSILTEFDDPDFRESYELKKVSKTVLLSALNALHDSGKSYEYLDSNIDEVVDKLIEMKPDLETSS